MTRPVGPRCCAAVGASVRRRGSAALPLRSDGVIVVFVGERAKVEMMTKDGVENLRDLAGRSGGDRIARALRHQRRRTCASRLNDPGDVQFLFADVELVAEHADLGEFVAFGCLSLALCAKSDPLLPFLELAQALDRI